MVQDNAPSAETLIVAWLPLLVTVKQRTFETVPPQDVEKD
jgi:hypothetical protein